jgi:CBS domain-containing protein
MDSLRAFGLSKLRVLNRRVSSADAVTVTEPLVACPRREGAISVDDCRECAEYQGHSFDRDRAESFVVCRAPNTEVPAPAKSDALVADIMSSRVLCVTEELGVEELVQVFLDENVTAVPVVDAARHPIGMITRIDLLRERRARALVAELMTPLAFSVTARVEVSQAAALMACEDIHQVPVVSDDGKVIGLLTSLDVLRWLARRNGEVGTNVPTQGRNAGNEPIHPWIAAMDVNAERMRFAFRWIESERAKQPDVPLIQLVEQARVRCELSRAQATWMQWTLDPESVAVQPKEPA